MCFLCGASVKTSHSCPAYQTLWLTDRTAAAWTVKLTNLLTGNSAGAAVTVEMKQQEGPGLQRTTDRTKRGFKTPAHRYNFLLRKLQIWQNIFYFVQLSYITTKCNTCYTKQLSRRGPLRLTGLLFLIYLRKVTISW